MGVLTLVGLLQLADARGFTYSVTPEGRLRVEGPAEQAELAAMIGERRFEIINAICPQPTRTAGKCADCGDAWDDLIGGLCFSCGELRKFLSSQLPCGCEGVARWRYADNGFYWRCSTHEAAPDNAVWSRKRPQPATVLQFERARVTA